MTVKEWMAEEQGKHFCHCGCGMEIKILKQHRYKGIPTYIRGHGGHYKTVDKWIEEEQGKHFCRCGCNQEIKIIRRHRFKGIPKYIRGHFNIGKKFSEETKKKHSEAMTGEKNHNFGKIKSEETRRKISDAHLGMKHTEESKQKMRDSTIGMYDGENNPFFGKHHTEEAKDKIRKARSNLSEETRQKLREARKHRNFPKSRTNPEVKFEDICIKYNLHFKYTGDGSLWIGKKEERQLNPDFIQADGQKIVVEIMGEWWHSPLLNHKVPVYANLNYRKKHYKKYGWKSYFIWETDLVRPDAEQFVLNTLAEVCNI